VQGGLLGRYAASLRFVDSGISEPGVPLIVYDACENQRRARLPCPHDPATAIAGATYDVIGTRCRAYVMPVPTQSFATGGGGPIVMPAPPDMFCPGGQP
jgi:hypothetical protein